ncbi:MAG: WD40/YVTN/BNR-like repeat-containing protein, partial [Candidatus Micrarchaeaceae archaeon]
MSVVSIEQGTCIYFLDSLPNVGFIADAGGIFKTTDGGYTWSGTHDIYVTFDFAFRDSLTGWRAGFLQSTTDGGRSWQIPSDSFGAFDVYYDAKDSGLFLAGGKHDTDGIWVSWDLGKTWSVVTNSVDAVCYGGFSFWNGDTGVVGPWCNGS